MRVLLCTLVFGCQSGIIESDSDEPKATDTGITEDTSEDTDIEPPPWPSDFSRTGPYTVSAKKGTTALSTGCDMDWTAYSPSEKVTETRVILAHGFLSLIHI